MSCLFGISNQYSPELLSRMAERLAHRGANQSAFETPFGGFMAGVSSGQSTQPWTKGKLAMVGELDLFDSQQLREQLHAIGSESSAQGAPELLLDAWIAMGPSALKHVNGDFALAIADLETGVLHLARDRSGSRPLYYASVGSGWAFASEYKALLAIPEISRDVDKASLHMLHERKVVPADRTLLIDVLQVPPQSVVTLEPNGSKRVDAYWSLPSDIDNADFETHRRELSSCFLQAVERRVGISDRIGISLSGGVDSIAMVAAVRKFKPKDTIRTYTIGDSVTDPEVTVARRIADHFKTEHQELVFSCENLGPRLRQLVWGLEDPIARTETLMTHDLCELAQGEVDVMIRGDGADGLFGGMPRHKILALAERIPLATGTLKDVYAYTQTGVMPKSPISGLLIRAYFRSKIPPSPNVVGYEVPSAPLLSFDSPKELLNQVLRKSPLHSLPMLLQKVERPHAQHGMRTISPFLDNDLVDLTQRMPSLHKNNGRRNKIVFREAVADFLPYEFARLPKYAQRVRETSEFCDALEGLWRDDNVASALGERGLFDAAELRALAVRPADGVWAPEHAMRIWTLIMTEYWAQAFLDQT